MIEQSGYLEGRSFNYKKVQANPFLINFYDSNTCDEWQGTRNKELIPVKFTKPGWQITFSDDFACEHKEAARAEVKRIAGKFN